MRIFFHLIRIIAGVAGAYCLAFPFFNGFHIKGLFHVAIVIVGALFFMTAAVMESISLWRHISRRRENK